MAIHFHNINIEKIKKETQDCVSITLAVPEELKTKFSYEAGQYLTFKTNINGEEVRRSYSLCSSPLENKWKVAVKKVPNGKFSSFANDILKVGDSIEVMEPAGNFTCAFNSENKNNYIAFAAGSGITPVISIIKTCLETEQQSSFTLFYGNKISTNIIFQEELDALKDLYLERFRIFHVFSKETDSSPIFSGRIDEAKLDTYCNVLIRLKDIDNIFLCGPEEMIFTLKDQLEKKDFDKNKILFELFSTPEDKTHSNPTEKNKTEYTPGDMAEVTIKIDDNTFEFNLDFDGDSILDKALSLGADMPFACKGGVCSTCRAKLIEGKVEMDTNYALQPDELKRGFILTCQSHPRSKKIFVDYDHN